MKASYAILALLLTAITALQSCSGRPDGVLGKEDMAQLIADIHAGESAIEGQRAYQTDSARRAFLEAIYKKHGVTREEVDSSYSWYGYNIDKYMDVYERAVEILQQRLDKAQELAGASADGIAEISTSFEGDSVDVWPGIRWRRFSANMPADMMTFTLENASHWERGDVYTLRAKTLDNRGPFIFTIAVTYTDGKVEYLTRNMSGDGWHEMPVALDSARSARQIYGIISYKPQHGENAYIDSISLMRVRWGGHYRNLRKEISTFENRTYTGKGNSSSSSSEPAVIEPSTPINPKPLPPASSNANAHEDMRLRPQPAMHEPERIHPKRL